MRFFQSPRSAGTERLLWSRDIRFATRVGQVTPGARILELADRDTDHEAIAVGAIDEQARRAPALGLAERHQTLPPMAG